MTTIDVFTNQDLLAEIKREFKEKAKPVH